MLNYVATIVPLSPLVNEAREVQIRAGINNSKHVPPPAPPPSLRYLPTRTQKKKQRKEVLSELQNRVDTLSSSLATSRDETAALKQEVASLREQNSFLRGMLSVQGNGNGGAADLPLPVSGPTGNLGRSHQGGGGRGASAAAAGASAILGAVGTGLAVISCVALSAAGFGENGGGGGGGGSHPGYGGGPHPGYGGVGGVHNGGVPGRSHTAYAARGGGIGYGSGSNNNMGGRRMLFSVEESGDLSLPAGGEEAGGGLSLGFGGGGGLLGGHSYHLLLGLVLVVGLVLVYAVARWTYRKATAQSNTVGGPRGRTLRRDRRKGNSGGGRGSLGGVWPVSRLLGLGGPVCKSM